MTSVVVGPKRIAGTDFRRKLGLQSTWFSVGTLALSSEQTRVRYGNEVALKADVEGLGRAVLERRIGAGPWKRLASVGGRAQLDVEPRAHTVYRLSVDGVSGPEVAVDVAPKLDVTPAGADVLAGAVSPVTRGQISVWRRVRSGWKLVARPRLDARGTFHAPLRLRAGDYRVSVSEDGRYASARADVHVDSRLLASLGY